MEMNEWRMLKAEFIMTSVCVCVCACMEYKFNFQLLNNNIQCAYVTYWAVDDIEKEKKLSVKKCVSSYVMADSVRMSFIKSHSSARVTDKPGERMITKDMYKWNQSQHIFSSNEHLNLRQNTSLIQFLKFCIC